MNFATLVKDIVSRGVMALRAPGLAHQLEDRHSEIVAGIPLTPLPLKHSADILQSVTDALGIDANRTGRDNDPPHVVIIDPTSKRSPINELCGKLLSRFGYSVGLNPIALNQPEHYATSYADPVRSSIMVCPRTLMFPDAIGMIRQAILHEVSHLRSLAKNQKAFGAYDILIQDSDKLVTPEINELSKDYKQVYFSEVKAKLINLSHYQSMTKDSQNSSMFIHDAGALILSIYAFSVALSPRNEYLFRTKDASAECITGCLKDSVVQFLHVSADLSDQEVVAKHRARLERQTTLAKRIISRTLNRQEDSVDENPQTQELQKYLLILADAEKQLRGDSDPTKMPDARICNRQLSYFEVLAYNAYVHEKNPERALQFGQMILEHTDNDPWALLMNSSMLVLLDRNLDEAANMASKALENCGPEMRASCLDTIGTIHCKKGDYSAAISALDEAMELDPIPTTAFYLGDALEKMGRDSEALLQYRKILDLGDSGLDWNNASHLNAIKAKLLIE